jgi:hypothetical protein
MEQKGVLDYLLGESVQKKIPFLGNGVDDLGRVLE